jgi:hypothetical protein
MNKFMIYALRPFGWVLYALIFVGLMLLAPLILYGRAQKRALAACSQAVNR